MDNQNIRSSQDGVDYGVIPWFTTGLKYSEGLISSTSPYINSAIALSYNELLRLVFAMSSPTLLDSIKTFFVDPSDAVGSIKMFPFVIPKMNQGNLQYLTQEFTYDNEPITGGYVAESFYSNLTQIFSGSLHPAGYVPKWYDYNGYTTIKVYLPFYGEVEIPPNEIIDREVRVYYAIDPSGDLLYFITALEYSTDTSHGSHKVIGKYRTNIAVDIPFGSSNLNDVNKNLILTSINTGISALALMAGIAVPPVATSTIETSPTISTERTVVRARGEGKYSRMRDIGSTETTIATGGTSTTKTYTSRPNVAQVLSDVASNSINSLNNKSTKFTGEIAVKPNLEQFGPTQVIMSICRPRLVEDNHAHYIGLPLNKYDVIGNYRGFTKVSGVRFGEFNITGPIPTLTEIDKIHSMLMDGIIIEEAQE